MVMATFLDCVNGVLRRIREDEVVTVIQSDYSKLIGDMVNEAKREVEDAWNWSVLRQTITVTTAASTSNYTLSGSNMRTKIEEAYVPASHIFLGQISAPEMNMYLNVLSAPSGRPYNYAFGNTNTSGTLTVDVFPIPDNVYTLKFNCYVPQADLVNDTDVIYVPSDVVIQGAYLRAINERGEDGGRLSDQQADLYRKTLANYISIEAGRESDLVLWEAV
jgi:hypothetical protein